MALEDFLFGIRELSDQLLDEENDFTLRTEIASGKRIYASTDVTNTSSRYSRRYIRS